MNTAVSTIDIMIPLRLAIFLPSVSTVTSRVIIVNEKTKMPTMPRTDTA